MTPADWYPLMRRLRAAGWERWTYTTYGIDEWVWYRNKNATNAQSIAVNDNVDGLRVDARINGRVVSVVGFDPADLDMWAGWLGVFDPAPEPIRRPLTPAELRVQAEVLARAATDPAVSDDTFAVLAPAIEGRPA